MHVTEHIHPQILLKPPSHCIQPTGCLFCSLASGFTKRGYLMYSVCEAVAVYSYSPVTYESFDTVLHQNHVRQTLLSFLISQLAWSVRSISSLL